MTKYPPGFIEETLRIALVNLNEDREYLGLQLSLAIGAIGEDVFNEERARYLLEVVYSAEELENRVTILIRMLGDRANIEVIKTALRCSYESAEWALNEVARQQEIDDTYQR